MLALIILSLCLLIGVVILSAGSVKLSTEVRKLETINSEQAKEIKQYAEVIEKLTKEKKQLTEQLETAKNQPYIAYKTNQVDTLKLNAIVHKKTNRFAEAYELNKVYEEFFAMLMPYITKQQFDLPEGRTRLWLTIKVIKPF